MDLIISVLRNSRGTDDNLLYEAFIENKNFDLINFDDQKWVDYYSENIISKIFRKLLRGLNQISLNKSIQDKIIKFKPRYFIVFKGSNIFLKTINIAKKNNVKTILIYPDLNPAFYGKNFLRAVKNYDQLYYTKPNLKEYFSNLNNNPKFINPFIPNSNSNKIKDYDSNIGVLFVGHYSRNKSIQIIDFIKKYKYKISIVGRGWGALKKFKHVNILGELYGDVIVNLYSKSLVVLGLLQKFRKQEIFKDVITSRTFLVPFYGGLLIHENNIFVQKIYGRNELFYFNDTEDLIDTINEIKIKNLRQKLWLKQKNNILKTGTRPIDLFKMFK